MIKKQYKTRNVRVGTVKKSMGREGLAVIAQERSPEFPWLLGRRQMLDVARNCAFRGVEAEFEKFTMNPRSAPGGILLHHPPDESSNLGIELLACQWGTVSLAVAVIESALDLTRPGKPTRVMNSAWLASPEDRRTTFLTQRDQEQ